MSLQKFSSKRFFLLYYIIYLCYYLLRFWKILTNFKTIIHITPHPTKTFLTSATVCCCSVLYHFLIWKQNNVTTFQSSLDFIQVFIVTKKPSLQRYTFVTRGLIKNFQWEVLITFITVEASNICVFFITDKSNKLPTPLPSVNMPMICIQYSKVLYKTVKIYKKI